MSSQFEVNTSSLVAGALTLTAALAWNEAAKAGIQTLYPQPTKGSFKAMLVYAVIVTLMIILVFHVIKLLTKKINNTRVKLPPVI